MGRDVLPCTLGCGVCAGPWGRVGRRVGAEETLYAGPDSISQGEGRLRHSPRVTVAEHGPQDSPPCTPIYAQATDNPAASGLFAQCLKTLQDRDSFTAVLFSSHGRKVSRGQGPSPG